VSVNITGHQGTIQKAVGAEKEYQDNNQLMTLGSIVLGVKIKLNLVFTTFFFPSVATFIESSEM